MPRTYESAMRAESAASTRTRIVRATVDLAFLRADVDMTLEEIATRAQTSVKTILRHFGSREALITAGIEAGSVQVAAERYDPGGDVDRSIQLLVAHYELRGVFVLRILAQDQPGAQRVAAAGRGVHRAWVESVFAETLGADDGSRDALVDQLVVVTDVYAWKLLRLDRGLSAAETTDRIRSMTRALAAG
jgi:AcrR family transcriptional regulator